MNIAELKGEKTVRALAKRLLEQASSTTKGTKASSSEDEMEAALLRLNPHLRRIADLEKGTPVLVPREFAALDPAGSTNPLDGNTGEWLRQGELALKSMRAAFGESVTQAGEQSERVQTWLKSDQTKEVLRRVPELKEVFRSVAAAAKSLPKEQAALVAAEGKALDQVQSELTNFPGTSPR